MIFFYISVLQEDRCFIHQQWIQQKMQEYYIRVLLLAHKCGVNSQFEGAKRIVGQAWNGLWQECLSCLKAQRPIGIVVAYSSGNLEIGLLQLNSLNTFWACLPKKNPLNNSEICLLFESSNEEKNGKYTNKVPTFAFTRVNDSIFCMPSRAISQID